MKKSAYTETLLAGGEASKVILRSDGHTNVVVKSSVHADLRNEAAALRLLAAHGVPVPRLKALRGRTVFMEYIPGANPKPKAFNAVLAGKVAAALRKLHSVHNNVIGRFDAPMNATPEHWIDFLHSRMLKNLKVFRRKGFLDQGGVGKLKDRFERLAVAGTRSFIPSFVHSDLHLDNLRVTPTGKVYIIDFEIPFWGDPLYDLAPFKYFHPNLYRALRKAYSPKPFANEKEAMRFYAFLHAIDIGSFDASIGKKAGVKRALRIAREG